MLLMWDDFIGGNFDLSVDWTCVAVLKRQLTDRREREHGYSLSLCQAVIG